MAGFFPMQEQFTKFTFNHAHLYILEEKIALFYLTSSLDVNCVFTHLILFPCFLLFSCNKCEFPVFFFFLFTLPNPLSDPCSLSPDLSFLQLTFLSHHLYPLTSPSQKPHLPIFFPIAKNCGAAPGC